MAQAGSLERLLRRDRIITAAALAVLCLAAWAYVISGAGLGVAAWRMTSIGPPAPVASAGMADMGGMGRAAGGAAAAPLFAPLQILLTLLMWWSMMVAMMAPSAAPMVLLYARVARSAGASAPPRVLGRTGWFVAGYLAVWLGFSAAAALLQLGFERLAWVSRGMMSAQSRGFAGDVLLLAGLYQLSPLQELCLRHCRSPAAFLSAHYRPGRDGALRLGFLHGAYCVGCCWLLMALLFVGGVMNLVWIAALTVLVAAKKMLPGGRWISRATGLGLVAAGLVVLLWRRG